MSLTEVALEHKATLKFLICMVFLKIANGQHFIARFCYLITGPENNETETDKTVINIFEEEWLTFT